MKKLLGVSIAAMLAVTPMMAHAAVDNNGLEALPMQGLNGQNQLEANTNIATTSYVQGAYNAVATQVNTVQTAINVDKTGAKNLSTGTIGANVKELDTAIGVVNDLKDANKTAANSVLRDDQKNRNLTEAVVAINNALANTTGNTTVPALANDGQYNYITAGSNTAANLVALDTGVGRVGANKNHVLTNNTVAGNLEALDTAVGKVTEANNEYAHLTGNASVATNLIELNGAIVTNDGKLTTLNGNIGDIGSVKDTVYNKAEEGKFTADSNSSLYGDNGPTTINAAIEAVNQKIDDANTASTLAQGNYYDAGANVKTAIAAVDSQVKTNEDAITKLNGSYVPLYGSWSTPNAVTGSVKLGSLGQTNPAPTTGN